MSDSKKQYYSVRSGESYPTLDEEECRQQLDEKLQKDYSLIGQFAIDPNDNNKLFSNGVPLPAAVNHSLEIFLKLRCNVPRPFPPSINIEFLDPCGYERKMCLAIPGNGSFILGDGKEWQAMYPRCKFPFKPETPLVLSLYGKPTQEGFPFFAIRLDGNVAQDGSMPPSAVTDDSIDPYVEWFQRTM